ncbi:MAG TPA: hypothetical protein VFP95_00030, partial [Gammaproteobacteria bacterium]|nr:hypothetical protein [Gammaproteobacteria bacterium]
MSSSFSRGARIATAIACLFVSPFSLAATDPITIDGSYEGNPDNHPDTLWISHAPVPSNADVVTSLN